MCVLRACEEAVIRAGNHIAIILPFIIRSNVFDQNCYMFCKSS